MGLGTIIHVSDDASNDLNRLFPSISATTVGPVTPETGNGLGYPAGPPPRRDPGVAGMGAIVPWPRIPYEWDLIKREIWTNNTPFKDTTTGMGDVPVYAGPTQEELEALYWWDSSIGQWLPKGANWPGHPPGYTVQTNDPKIWYNPTTQLLYGPPGYQTPLTDSQLYGTNRADPYSDYHFPSGTYSPANAAFDTTYRLTHGGPATIGTGTEPLYGVNGSLLQPPPPQGNAAATGNTGTTPPAADAGMSMSSMAMIGAAVLVGLMALKR